MGDQDDREGGRMPSSKFLGSLREALAAASRDDTTRISTAATQRVSTAPQSDQSSEVSEGTSMQSSSNEPGAPGTEEAPPLPSAADAAREARGGTPNIPPVDADEDRHVEFDAPPTTRVVRQARPTPDNGETARTQLVRGRQEPERGEFGQDPVVGWLVIVGGPGIGSYRAIYEGNNTVGRSSSNRIPIDFGDDAISAHEQAYVRYDSTDRSFLFVPNLAKTNVVSVNDKRPASAVPLTSMDVITMGRTQLVFVAFCGPEFDWSELSDLKKA